MRDLSRAPHRRHVLTVVHAAERTGPPVLALRFLNWLRVHQPGWTLSTLSLGGDAELLRDFAALGPTHVAMPYAPDRGGRAHRTLARIANRQIWGRIRRHGPVDVVHVHCVGSMRVLDAIPAPVPVLCHVHELSVGQELHVTPRARARVADADRYVTVADVVTRELLERFPIDPSTVEREWGFVTPDVLDTPRDRTALGVREDEVLVVSSGVRHWRKAPELFVRAARATVRRRPDIRWRFVWVGGSARSGLDELVRAAGLQDHLQFIGHRPDALRWIAAADAFVLTAREDAFPLVCVEATSLGVPIVTFDNGGAVELVVRANNGVVVPYPQVDELAEVIVELADDPSERHALGVNGRSFARDHLTIDTAGPALLGELERTMLRK